jgi:hypothetical protein
MKSVSVSGENQKRGNHEDTKDRQPEGTSQFREVFEEL